MPYASSPTNCPHLVADILKAIGCKGDEDEPVNGELMPLRKPCARILKSRPQQGIAWRRSPTVPATRNLNGLLIWRQRKLGRLSMGPGHPGFIVAIPRHGVFRRRIFSLVKTAATPRLFDFLQRQSSIRTAVHLTVASVRYESHGRQHKGVCSTFWPIWLMTNATSNVFSPPNKVFRVPEDDSLPMIMVGPAPASPPSAPFCRNANAVRLRAKTGCFLATATPPPTIIYHEEMEAMQTSGLLTRLDLAFSRDQDEKIYVQDRMLKTARNCLRGWNKAVISLSAATPTGWQKMSIKHCMN